MAETLEGIFYLVPEADILAVRSKAMSILKDGGGKTPMTFSIGGQSGSKQFVMSVAKILLESRAALQRINPSLYGRRVTMLLGDFSNTSFA